MTLEDWRKNVSSHLDCIQAGAEMAARRAKMLPVRPEFETNAQIALAESRKVLEAALADIIAAQNEYDSKPVEQSRAA